MQRPVHESLLDLDLTLDALACDPLNSSDLYAVKLSPAMAARLTASAGVSAADASADVHPSTKVNGTQFQRAATSKTKPSEETVREAFSHFGTVRRVLLPANPGRCSRHVRVRE